jgi:hypothetical protein
METLLTKMGSIVGMNGMRSQLILTAFLWLLITDAGHAQKAPTGYSQADYERGRTDAQNDIKSGLLAYEFAGLPAPSDDEEIRLFRERYHIEFRRVAGDEIRIEAISHMIGYNEIALHQFPTTLCRRAPALPLPVPGWQYCSGLAGAP